MFEQKILNYNYKTYLGTNNYKIIKIDNVIIDKIKKYLNILIFQIDEIKFYSRYKFFSFYNLKNITFFHFSSKFI